MPDTRQQALQKVLEQARKQGKQDTIEFAERELAKYNQTTPTTPTTRPTTQKGFDPNIDYSTRISEAIGRGATGQEVDQLVRARVTKALQTPGLEQYAYDPVYEQAQQYIRGQQQFQQQQSDLDQLLAARRQEAISGLQARAAGQQQALTQQQATIRPQYAQARTQADVLGQQLSRRLAERGIQSGIGTGDLGQTRLAQNLATQQAVTGLTQQEQLALDDIARQRAAIQSGLAADIQTTTAGLEAEALQSRLAQQEANRQFALQQAQLTGQYLGQPTLAGRQAQLNIEGQQISNAIQQYQLSALPEQTKRELALIDQQLRAGQISNQSAAVQLQQLTDPNSFYNRQRALELQSGQLGLTQGAQQVQAGALELEQLRRQLQGQTQPFADLGIQDYQRQVEALDTPDEQVAYLFNLQGQGVPQATIEQLWTLYNLPTDRAEIEQILRQQLGLTPQQLQGQP